MSERGRRRPLAWLADRTVDVVPVESIVEHIDVNAVAQRIDLDDLLDGVDIDALVARVDLDALVARVDLDALVADVDLDALVARIDINAVAARVDINALAARVDLDALLDRVDPNALLDRVEPDRLLDRMDPDRLMSRVDVAALVDRAGVKEIVADSTGAVAGSFIDTIRRQLVSLDTLAENALYRLLGRNPDDRPATPKGLRSRDQAVHDGRRQVSGRYAGPVTRVAAFLIDMLVVFWTFTLGSAGLVWVLNAMSLQLPGEAWFGAVVLGLWYFIYSFVSLAVAGHTLGKGLIGLRVLEKDGDPLRSGEAALRVAVLPFSFAFFGIGILMSLPSPRRATLHDLIARTCEVYDWGDRPAELPAPLTAWIESRSAARYGPSATSGPQDQ